MTTLTVNYNTSTTELTMHFQPFPENAFVTNFTANQTSNGQIIASIPNIIYVLNYVFNFGEKENTNVNSEVHITTLKKTEVYSLLEFNANWTQIFKRHTVSRNMQAILNQISTTEFKSQLIQLLKTNAQRQKLTDCWFLNTFDYDIKYITAMSSSRHQISPTPVDTITYSDGVEYYTKKNEHKNPNHPCYHFLNSSVSKKKIYNVTIASYFEALYDLVQPVERHEYLNFVLDYFFASFFKHEIKKGILGNVNYPILVIFGDKDTGKTWLVKNVMSLIYPASQNDSYTYNKTVFAGSSPLTRLNLENNNTMPIVFEEIDDLSSFVSVVNLYLTDGYFFDSICTTAGIKKRVAFYSPIIITNALRVNQYNSDAILDRFLFYEIKTKPDLQNVELQHRTYEFAEKYLSGGLSTRIGGGIVKLILENKTNIINHINHELKHTHLPVIELLKSTRAQAKLRYLMIGKILKQWIFREINFTKFTDFGIDKYLHYLDNRVLNTTKIQTSNSKMYTKLNDLLFKPLTDYGDKKIYAVDLFMSDDVYTAWNMSSSILLDPENANDINTMAFKKFVYYLERELGLRVAVSSGEVLFTSRFLELLNSGDYHYNAKELLEIFGSYATRPSSSLYYSCELDPMSSAHAPRYILSSRQASAQLKFNARRYLTDTL